MLHDTPGHESGFNRNLYIQVILYEFDYLNVILRPHYDGIPRVFSPNFSMCLETVGWIRRIEGSVLRSIVVCCAAKRSNNSWLVEEETLYFSSHCNVSKVRASVGVLW